jgi:hypothetical protein
MMRLPDQWRLAELPTGTWHGGRLLPVCLGVGMVEMQSSQARQWRHLPAAQQVDAPEPMPRCFRYSLGFSLGIGPVIAGVGPNGRPCIDNPSCVKNRQTIKTTRLRKVTLKRH